MLGHENYNTQPPASSASDKLTLSKSKDTAAPTKQPTIIPTLASRANQLLKSVYDDVRSRFADHPNFLHLRNTLKHIDSVSSPSKLSDIATDINFNWAAVNSEKMRELGDLLSNMETESDDQKKQGLETSLKQIREEVSSFYNEQMTKYLNVDAKIGNIKQDKEDRYDQAISGFKDIFIVFSDIEKGKNVRRKVMPPR